MRGWLSKLRHVLATGVLAAVAVAFAVPASAVPVAGGSVVPTDVPKYVTPLVIPPVMPKSADANTPAADYNIAVRQFNQQILPGGIWNTLNGRSDAFGPTTVWSYGRAEDPLPTGGVAPAANSSFNYPAYTVENTSGAMTKVRWINELVAEPTLCNYASPAGDPNCDFLPHLLTVDQTLHWANPPATGCVGMNPNGTDCETLNGAPYLGPVPIVTHVHGAHVNPQSDGYPEAWWLPAAGNIDPSYATSGSIFDQWDPSNSVPGSAFYAYENTQPATTIWYHDHSMGMTRLNVYAGPAGFWLIRGGANDLSGSTLPGPAPVAGEGVLPLNIPGDAVRNSIREIPIVIQDRSFDYVDANGNVLPDATGATGTALWYPSSRTDFDGFTGPYIGGLDPNADISPFWNPEAFFNVMVVNGVSWPALDVAQERYRFRLLNGCNSRTLNLSMFVVTGAGTDGIYGTGDDVLGAEVPFFQIGGDQGFLPQVTMIQTGFLATLDGGGTLPTVTPTPGDMQALLMMPAERADVIVDFSGLAPGTRVRVINTADDAPFGGLDPLGLADADTTGQVMEFVVDASINRTGGDPSTPPASLTLPAETGLGASDNMRQLSLNEMESDTTCIAIDPALGDAYVSTLYTAPPGNPNFVAECLATTVDPGLAAVPAAPRQALLGVVVDDPVAGGLVAVPQRWMDPAAVTPILGTTETWEIFNTTMDAHPIHVHLVRFQIVEREDMSMDPVTGVMTPLGTTYAPLPTEAGFKDTVVAYPGQITRVKATFDIAGLYVWHCHIVEHEDNEMMLPYRVLEQVKAPAYMYAPTTNSTGTFALGWGTSNTPGVTYVVEEATSADFATPTQVYSGTERLVTLTGHSGGTFYYRVKATQTGMADSVWVAGGNALTISLPTAAPAYMYVPAATSTENSFVAWGTSSSASVTYVVEQSTASDFTANLVQVYSGTSRSIALSGLINGNYYYRVKATRAGASDSTWAVGPNPLGVSATAINPAYMWNPAGSATGTYALGWGTSNTVGAGYEVEESTAPDFSVNVSQVYSGTLRSVLLSGRTTGTYYYRVRAVKTGINPSAWVVSPSGCTVP